MCHLKIMILSGLDDIVFIVNRAVGNPAAEDRTTHRANALPGCPRLKERVTLSGSQTTPLAAGQIIREASQRNG